MRERGINIIIVGVGGVVYLLGMVVLLMMLLVIGVLIEIKSLKGIDFLLLIV